jgi:hypothetical protein
MPPQSRYDTDGGMPPLTQDYNDLRGDDQCFVSCLCSGFLPTDTVQTATLTMDAQTPIVLKAGPTAPIDTNCSAVAEPSGTAWLFRFYLTSAILTVLEAAPQHYKIAVTSVRSGATIERDVQRGTLTAVATV